MKSNLGILLESKGISLYRLAKETEIPYASVHALAGDQGKLEKAASKTLFIIADFLGVSMEGILHGDSLVLPSRFKATCFWDADFPSLKKENSAFAIIRLLRYGGLDGMRYVESRFAKEEIIQAIKERRDLDDRLANYLSLHYSIDKNEMAFYAKRLKFAWKGGAA